MRKASFLLNIILLFAVGGLYYMHFFSESKAIDEKSISNTKQEDSLYSPIYSKIVFINSDSLMENYQYVKVIKKELESERSKAENEFQYKVKQLEKEYETLREKAPYMTNEEGQQKQMELMEKEQNLNLYKDELSLKLLENEQKKNEQLYNQVLEYLGKYNQDKKYQFILSYRMGGGILFANDSLDITKEIIDSLNKEYIGKKNN